MSKLACVPHGLTFDGTKDYLEHVATCDRVLPTANRAAEFWLSELRRNGEPPKKRHAPRNRPSGQGSLL